MQGSSSYFRSFIALELILIHKGVVIMSVASIQTYCQTTLTCIPLGCPPDALWTYLYQGSHSLSEIIFQDFSRTFITMSIRQLFFKKHTKLQSSYYKKYITLDITICTSLFKIINRSVLVLISDWSSRVLSSYKITNLQQLICIT